MADAAPLNDGKEQVILPMSEQRTGVWAGYQGGGRAGGRCTRCGASPLAGRGLCPYHYSKWRTHLRAVGAFNPIPVPVDEARQHVLALRAAGVGLPRIAELSGLQAMTLFRLCDPGRKLIDRRIAAAVLDVDIPTRAADPALAPGARVSVIPSQRRIRALAVCGYGQDYLLDRLGLKVGSCALNKVYSAALPHVTAKRHRAIAALFDELVWTPGPSKRATRDAVRKGWWGPWAWEDIDDLDCVPDAVASRATRRRQAAHRARQQWLAEQLEDHRAIGRVRNDKEAAALLGVSVDALERKRYRDREREAAAADVEDVAS